MSIVKKHSFDKEKNGVCASFNDVARQPARSFEQQTRMTGIAGRYIFPENFTASEYEDRYTWLFSANGFKRIPEVLKGTGLPEETMTEVPQGWRVKGLLAHVSEGYKALLFTGWCDIERLNPQTEKVVFDRNDVEQTYQALLGVTSGFNIDDINFFLDLSRQGFPPGAHSRTLPGYNEMRLNVESRAGTPLYWVASMNTLKKIKQQLDTREF